MVSAMASTVHSVPTATSSASSTQLRGPASDTEATPTHSSSTSTATPAMSPPTTTAPTPSPHFVTLDELTDFRAMQRTFDLAYSRTALGELSFAVLVLKLFQPKFQLIGFLYTFLCLGHVAVGVWRRRLAAGNDQHWKDLQILSHSTNPPFAPVIHTSFLPPTDDNHSHENERFVVVPSDMLNASIAHDMVALIDDSQVIPPLLPSTDDAVPPNSTASLSSSSSRLADSFPPADESTPLLPPPQQPTSQTILRIVNNSFRTAGDVIALITAFTLFLQVAILFSLYEI